MSSDGGGSNVGVIVAVGIGAAVVVVVVIAVIIYCYMKARKENNKQMTKSADIFTTSASNTKLDYPKTRSRVNMYPDPEAARREKRRERSERGGHVNPAYSRHGSDSSSVASNDTTEGRDISPPRVRRTRGGHDNEAFSSESSYDESSSLEDDRVVSSFSVESEGGNSLYRNSFKKATKGNDSVGRSSGKRNVRNGTSDQMDSARVHRSRRDQFSGIRSDSPLTVETLQKHEKRTQEKKPNDDIPRKNDRKRGTSPSRSVESSSMTQTSNVSEFTENTATTMSSGRRYARNESFRRNSPSRSSSHRRYKKDKNTDSSGRKRPQRTPSGERKHRERERQRSRSPGSHRSRRSTEEESRKQNKDQAMLPIFSDPKMKGKNSVV